MGWSDSARKAAYESRRRKRKSLRSLIFKKQHEYDRLATQALAVGSWDRSQGLPADWKFKVKKQNEVFGAASDLNGDIDKALASFSALLTRNEPDTPRAKKTMQALYNVTKEIAQLLRRQAKLDSELARLRKEAH